MNSDNGLIRGRTRSIPPQESPSAEEEVDEDGEPIIQTHVNEDGTTSSYFDKRKLKIAPRSTLQFKVGPPFEFVGNYYHVTESYTGRMLDLCVLPRIDRGFDFIEGEWVGYKRNYFTLVSSFEAVGWSLNEFLNGTFELHGDRGQKCRIKYLAVNIKAKNDDDYTEINLVQHTAKRDKGPQFTPAMAPVIPSPLPNHQIIREASNVRNIAKMKKYDATFYFHRDHPENCSSYNEESLINTYPNDCIQKVARYERVQFASSINVKKPAQQNRHFRLHVVLGAVISKGINHYQSNMSTIRGDILDSGAGGAQKDLFVPLQEMRTPPLIIRGRSPSNYTTSQRIAVRTSSRSSSFKKESNIGIVNQYNPMLATQNSSSQMGPISVSPNKPRPGRPPKRKAKVLSVTSPVLELPPENLLEPALEDILNEELPVEQSPSDFEATKRVETLEHIESILQAKGPLALQSPNPILEHEIYRPPLLSRQESIDPKDIEVKYNDDRTPSPSVGPLQMLTILKSQGSDNNDVSDIRKVKNNKKRKLSSTITTSTTLELSLQDTMKLLDDNGDAPGIITNYEEPNPPVSPLHPQNIECNQIQELSLGEEFNSISLSFLADNSSYNYYHIPNNGGLSELETVPRIFNDRAIGAQEAYNDKSTDHFLSKDAHDAINGLPSQMVDAGDIYQELSFYKH